MREERSHFSGEFKRDAVQLVTGKGMQVGKEIPLSLSALSPFLS